MYEIIKAKLENLQTGTDLGKAKLENSPNINRFVGLLIENPSGWLFVRKWMQQERRTSLLLVNGDFNAKTMRDNLSDLINTRYLREIAIDFLDWINGLDENQANQMNNFLLELLRNELLAPKREVLSYCPSCQSVSLTLLKNLDSFTTETCENCKGVKLRQILSCSPIDEIKRSIWNGQLLEVYTKKILEKEGVKFIGGHADGYECFTSIRYSTSVGEGEIDCIGTFRNTMMFFETKMTTLSPTEFKKANDIFDDIFAKLTKEIHELNELKVFIAFRIDQNIDTATCHNCHFVDLYEEKNIARSILNRVSKSQETIDAYLQESGRSKTSII
jgi:predicted nucleic-acid-binding Zn-ribbon protein